MKKFARNLAVTAAVVATLPVGVLSASAATTNTAGPSVLQTAHSFAKIKANATSTYQNGMTPAQMKKAYGLDTLSQTGAGQTIAIVDAYGSPTAQNDLNVFDSQFGLPSTTINIQYPTGQPAKADGGWALETMLDLQWAHSIAPQANLMLVVAKSASITDLMAAIDYATSHGATVVSNSWGGGESSSLYSSYDSHFNKAGIAIFASSGDNGAGASWPANSNQIVAVGGTTLSYDSAGNWLGETAWSGSGGAISAYESAPAAQSVVSSIVGTKRGMPDLSMDADPNSGVAVYSSTADQGQKGWFQVGGTSLSSPMTAAVVSLADQSRTSKLSTTQVLNSIYNTYSGSSYSVNFHDITSGSNGNAATTGYDLVTGVGAVRASLVNTLVNAQ